MGETKRRTSGDGSPQLDGLDRRRFLTSALGGAGLAFVGPFALSRSLSARPPASERTTVALIGSGKRGHTLLRNVMRFPEAQVVAVCDVEPIRREHARKRVEDHYGAADGKSGFRGCSVHVDYREIIAREDIDAVIIATPDHWHAHPVLDAARAGKDIYCEKPLSLTIHEARRMADVVGESGVVFQTGSQQRSEFDGRFRRACELVRNGRIGDVLTINIGVGGPSVPCDLPEQPVPDGVDWDRWLGPAPLRGYNEVLCPKGMHSHFPAWRNYQEYSGGQMTDWGAHHFDIAQWGLGMDASGPVEIHPPDGKDFKTLTYRYANGVVMYHGGSRGVRFNGTKGWVEVSRGELHTYPESLAEESIGDSEIKLYKASNHMGNWLECIRSRQPTICPAEVGCRSVTVCHLGNLAYWHGRSLRWDPKAYRFVGDDEANTWLDRPKREPWTLT